MSEVRFRSDVVARLEASTGNDEAILRAMLVSTDKDDEANRMEKSAQAGRLNFLMANRHGSPFEHASMTFYVEAPIFVFREWHRHRIGISINEQSGRYSELPPMFYVPPPHRPLKQVGKPGSYTFEPGDPEQWHLLDDIIRENSRQCYEHYKILLENDVAKEVARMVLPVNIYSKMYWTCNPRSLMAFLSLRTYEEDATFPSKPQWEIEQAARLTEQVFEELFPLTYEAFNKNGRVCP